MSPMHFPIGSRQDHNSLPDEGSSPSSNSAPATMSCRVPLTVASRGVAVWVQSALGLLFSHFSSPDFASKARSRDDFFCLSCSHISRTRPS